jgi:hypothetical protein
MKDIDSMRERRWLNAVQEALRSAAHFAPLPPEWLPIGRESRVVVDSD